MNDKATSPSNIKLFTCAVQPQSKDCSTVRAAKGYIKYREWYLEISRAESCRQSFVCRGYVLFSGCLHVNGIDTEIPLFCRNSLGLRDYAPYPADFANPSTHYVDLTPPLTYRKCHNIAIHSLAPSPCISDVPPWLCSRTFSGVVMHGWGQCSVSESSKLRQLMGMSHISVDMHGSWSVQWSIDWYSSLILHRVEYECTWQNHWMGMFYPPQYVHIITLQSKLICDAILCNSGNLGVLG
jgi:hypothetical protein